MVSLYKYKNVNSRTEILFSAERKMKNCWCGWAVIPCDEIFFVFGVSWLDYQLERCYGRQWHLNCYTIIRFHWERQAVLEARVFKSIILGYYFYRPRYLRQSILPSELLALCFEFFIKHFARINIKLSQFYIWFGLNLFFSLLQTSLPPGLIKKHRWILSPQGQQYWNGTHLYWGYANP